MGDTHGPSFRLGPKRPPPPPTITLKISGYATNDNTASVIYLQTWLGCKQQGVEACPSCQGQRLSLVVWLTGLAKFSGSLAWPSCLACWLDQWLGRAAESPDYEFAQCLFHILWQLAMWLAPVVKWFTVAALMATWLSLIVWLSGHISGRVASCDFALLLHQTCPRHGFIPRILSIKLFFESGILLVCTLV